MVQVTLQLGKGYIEDLSKRMKAARPAIAQAELAREMRPPVSPTQATRWFTKNEDRRVSPSLDTVKRIEEAMIRLERKRARGA